MDGGKSTCQAVAAARLGAPVMFVSLVGSDERGRWWRSFLEREGIDTRWLKTAEGVTDTGVVLLPPSRAPAIVSVTALSSRIDAPMVHDATDAIERASMLLCPLEAPASSVKEAFRVARAAAVPTLLNPAPADGIDDELLGSPTSSWPTSMRRRSSPERMGAPGARRGAGGAPRPCARGGDRGGRRGGFAGSAPDRAAVHVAAPRVEVVDTTGAGDAFVGAFAVGLGRGATVEEAVRTGVTVGEHRA